MIISGNGEQVPVDELKRAIKDDFVWFRDADRTYVIVDPALLERADRAWSTYETLDASPTALKSDKHAAYVRVQSEMRALIDQARKTGKASLF